MLLIIQMVEAIGDRVNAPILAPSRQVLRLPYQVLTPEDISTPEDLHPDFEGILIPENLIAERVEQLGQEISHDYEEDLVLFGVLKGSIIFMADLARKIDVTRMQMEFMGASSYGLGATSSGNVEMEFSPKTDVSNKHVLFTEDIVDTGTTMAGLIREVLNRGAQSARVCSLLSKPSRREKEVQIEYLGFEIPDEFVVGYGMDFGEIYRELPYVAVLKREVYEPQTAAI